MSTLALLPLALMCALAALYAARRMRLDNGLARSLGPNPWTGDARQLIDALVALREMNGPFRASIPEALSSHPLAEHGLALLHQGAEPGRVRREMNDWLDDRLTRLGHRPAWLRFVQGMAVVFTPALCLMSLALALIAAGSGTRHSGTAVALFAVATLGMLLSVIRHAATAGARHRLAHETLAGSIVVEGFSVIAAGKSAADIRATLLEMYYRTEASAESPTGRLAA